MKVEYLVILKKEDGQTDLFWSDPEIIKKFLKSKSKMITIQGDQLFYNVENKPPFIVDLIIRTNEIQDRNETFLILEMEHKGLALSNDNSDKE
ncbi:MAG: hypothetical protein ACKPEQ_11650, partial [Dolichospermum sp.]